MYVIHCSASKHLLSLLYKTSFKLILYSYNSNPILVASVTFAWDVNEMAVGMGLHANHTLIRNRHVCIINLN